MSAPFTVNPRIRDITFEFDHSCNCIGRRYDPDMQVYVNSKGQVVEFDINKVIDDQETMKKSIANLDIILNRMIEDRQWENQDIRENISQKIREMKRERFSPLTREMVEDIVDDIKYRRK